jgi:hypothetical protein
MDRNVVWARSFSGWNFSVTMLFGVGPKFDVICGRCDGGFSRRIPVVSYPVVRCPCGVANKLNIIAY